VAVGFTPQGADFLLKGSNRLSLRGLMFAISSREPAGASPL
jgi:hypothetical protein